MGILDYKRLERHADNHFWKGPKSEYVKAHFRQFLNPVPGFFGNKYPEITREEFEAGIKSLRENPRDLLKENEIDAFEEVIRTRQGWTGEGEKKRDIQDLAE